MTKFPTKRKVTKVVKCRIGFSIPTSDARSKETDGDETENDPHVRMIRWRKTESKE